MAKRKKRKEEKKNKFEYSIQLYGIVLIILSIMAFGAGKPLGYIGKLMRGFAIFLFGTLDWLFLITLFGIGCYILFKGKAPSFWSTKFIGILIVTIGVLVFSHLNYVTENNGITSQVFEETLNDIMKTFENIKQGEPFTVYGSGIIGCSLAVLFNLLFDTTGTKIVSCILMITGACFFTGFSIIEFIKTMFEKGKKLVPRGKGVSLTADSNEVSENDKKSVVIINDNNSVKEEEVTEPKLVISSLEELKRMNNEVKEENKEVVSDNNSSIEHTNTNNYVLPTLSLLMS
jgi:hypothetical protein